MNFWYKITWGGIIGEAWSSTELNSRISEIIGWGGKFEDIKIEVIAPHA